MNYAEESLKKHAEWKGKIEVVAVPPVKTKDDLSLAYTDSRWQIITSPALLRALAGGIAY